MVKIVTEKDLEKWQRDHHGLKANNVYTVWSGFKDSPKNANVQWIDLKLVDGLENYNGRFFKICYISNNEQFKYVDILAPMGASTNESDYGEQNTFSINGVNVESGKHPRDLLFKTGANYTQIEDSYSFYSSYPFTLTFNEKCTRLGLYCKELEEENFDVIAVFVYL